MSAIGFDVSHHVDPELVYQDISLIALIGNQRLSAQQSSWLLDLVSVSHLWANSSQL